MPRLLAALSVLLLSACTLPTLRVQGRYGRFDASGFAGVSSSGASGSADLEELDLEEDDAPAGRADLKFGAPHLIALAQVPSFEGRGTLDVTVDDGQGNTITQGATVDSRLDLGQYALALVFDLVPGDTVEVAIGFGAAYVDLGLRFDEVGGTGTSVATEQEIPVPLVAGAASVWIGDLELAGFGAGMQYNYEDDSVLYLEADVYARWELLGGDKRLRGSLVAGYRRTELDLEYDDDSAIIDTDLVLDGLYLGFELAL